MANRFKDSQDQGNLATLSSGRKKSLPGVEGNLSLMEGGGAEDEEEERRRGGVNEEDVADAPEGSKMQD